MDSAPNFESSDWARQYFELAGVILVGIAPDGRVLLINQKGSEVLGSPQPEIVGKDWFETFLPAHARADVRHFFLQLMTGAASAPERSESPVLQKDGAERLIAWRNDVMRDRSGCVVAVLSSGEDVTDRRRAEAALRDSEARFCATFEQAAVGMAHVGLDGRWLRFNEKLCEITGYSRRELETLTFRDVSHPEDHDVDLAQAEDLRAGRIPSYTMEKRYLRKDGSIVWINLTVSLLRDARGQPDYYIAVVEDISARKEAEEMQRMALSAAQAGAWKQDVKTGARVWSPETYHIFGLDRSEGPLDYRTWLARCVHPDDRGVVHDAFRQAAATAGGDFRIEYRSSHPERGLRWVTSIGQVISNAHRRPLRAYGLSLDVTERRQMEEALRQNEERLRLAVDAGSIGIWDWEIGSGLVTPSEGIVRLIGVAPERFAGTFDEYLAAVHPEDKPHVEQALQQALADQADYRTESRIVSPEGEVRWIAAQAIVLRDHAGEPARMVGIYRDITTAKTAEERQRWLVAELDHRVKNNLATVRAIAAQTLNGSPERTAFLGRLSALAEAHDLLADHYWENVDFADLVAQVLAAYPADRVATQGPTLAVSPPAAQTLALALHELATNAAKHGALSSETGRVDVGWSIEGEGEPSLQLDWVEGGGPPVAPPTRAGFGTDVIQGSIAFELGGTAELRFLPAGLRARLSIPVRKIAPALRD